MLVREREGQRAAGSIKSKKNIKYPIGNRNRDLLASRSSATPKQSNNTHGLTSLPRVDYKDPAVSAV